jgi:kumamolisin
MRRHRIIPGSERRAFVKSDRVGPCNPNGRMTVTLVLSPESTRDHALAVVRQARRFGLTRLRATPHGIVFSGRVADMQRTFQVSLHEHVGPDGPCRCRSGPYSVPEGFGSNVVAVLGLDTRPQAKPHHRAHAVPLAASGARYPRQFAEAYGFPRHGGRGHSVGIVSLGGAYQSTAMRQAFAATGLLQTPGVSVSGRQRTVQVGATIETMLDAEIVATVVPYARTCIYFRPNTTAGFYNAIASAVQAGHDAVSISWGNPEELWNHAAMTAFNILAMRAGQQGVTITAASGDNGSDDGQPGPVETDFPASAPYILGIGGTTIALTGNIYQSEVVWNTPSGATGGGYSEFFALPDYQVGVNTPGNTFRMVPDVAAVGDPATGYIIHLNGRNMVIGGTSGGAPLWAALVCRLNAILGRRLGFIHPVLYGLPAGSLRDIVIGGNGAYSAGVGYDRCTGLGTPPSALASLLV